MSYRYTFLLLGVLTLAMLAAPSVLAQSNAKAPTVRPHSPQQSDLPARTGEIVIDGSFEEGSGAFWEEASTNFGTPLCQVGACGTNPDLVPRTGEWWAWFGGIDAEETGSVSQEVTIPTGSYTLSFWLRIPTAESTGTFEVTLDEEVLFSATEADAADYAAYTEVTVDVSEYADDSAHELKFESVTNPGGVTNFFLDDVAIMPPTTASEAGAQPQAATLAPVYPNPFADRASVSVELDAAQRVSVEVFNVLGQRVATLFSGTLQGARTFMLDGATLENGLYVVRLQGEDFVQSRKVVLSR